MAYKKTFNPCDECRYSYSKHNQDVGVCKICEFQALLDADVSPKSEWISVTERLPDEANDYIVALRYSSGAYFSTKRSYSKERGWYGVSPDHYYRETAVTHWMPLPEPPKEGE